MRTGTAIEKQTHTRSFLYGDNQSIFLWKFFHDFHESYWLIFYYDDVIKQSRRVSYNVYPNLYYFASLDLLFYSFYLKIRQRIL